MCTSSWTNSGFNLQFFCPISFRLKTHYIVVPVCYTCTAAMSSPSGDFIQVWHLLSWRLRYSTYVCTKWSIIFLVRSLKIGFQVTVNSKEDAVLSRVALYTHDFSLFGFSLLSQTDLGKLIQKITSGITSRLSNRCLCKKSSVQYIYQGRFHVYIPDQIKKVLKDLFASGSRLGDMYIYIFSKFKKHFENIQHIFVVSVTIIALDCGFSLRIPQNADCLR